MLYLVLEFVIEQLFYLKCIELDGDYDISSSELSPILSAINFFVVVPLDNFVECSSNLFFCFLLFRILHIF